ncbi:hypothetical protein [Nocardia sp. NPDC049149]|uniref:hypothetical protein n=1 Tax=Nocardia sp. NPDC049149 TaxID=3364315 RepID=UPI00371D7566
MAAGGLGSRIAHLRALIDHPATGAEERATAERMLLRLLRKAGDGAGLRAVGDRTYGRQYDKVGRHADLPEIVAMIRADLAFVRTFSVPGLPTELEVSSPVRAAPAEISYSVDQPSYGRIVITIEGVPAEWGWVSDGGIATASPALQALAEELAEIIDAYNHDGSDTGKRFFGSVRTADTTLVW